MLFPNIPKRLSSSHDYEDIFEGAICFRDVHLQKLDALRTENIR